MALRTALLLCALLLGAPAASGKERSAGGWQSVSLATAAPAELGDLRNPTVAHETRAGPEDSIEIGTWILRFRPRKNDRSVEWTRKRKGAAESESKHTGRLRLPGLLLVPETHGTRYPLWVRVDAPGGALRVGSAHGLALPLAKERGYLVDSDRDGVLGSNGDGYIAPQSRTVAPWCGEAWDMSGGKRFRKAATGKWEAADVELPHPLDRDHCATWCLLQSRRQQCGLLPVGYDPTLEDAMRKHAVYASRTGQETHHEDPKLEGYTPEGDEAGRNSIIGWSDTSMLSALQMHLATLYHRTRPLQPGLTHTAIVFHKGIFMLNVFQRRGGPLRDAILVYPPHGMQDVPQRFHPQGEHPMPVDGRPGVLGTAVAVFSEPLRTATALASVPSLEVRPRKKKKKPVESHFHYPGHPPSAEAGTSNRGNVARIPVYPLRTRTDYECRANIALPGGKPFVYRWTFTTRSR